MQPTPEQIKLFVSLFSGLTQGHGTHRLTGAVNDQNGKIEANSWWESEEVTEELFSKHLKGKVPLGIAPLRTDSKVLWSAIDVDDYTPQKGRQILDTIYAHQLPLVPFRTKSGGLHLYLFFKTDVKAISARAVLDDYKRIFMIPKKTEIFPKQDILPIGSTGNWMNLPYFNAPETNRYLIKVDGSGATLKEALEIILAKQTTLQNAKDALEALPLADAPPCIQAIYLTKNTEYRNNYIFNIARYAKIKFGDDVEAYQAFVLQANQDLTHPLDVKEIVGGTFKSHEKKDYSYKCGEEPIVSICDKECCKKREFGVGGGRMSDLNFEEFTKVMYDPPYYEWKIDGKILKFFDESEIIKQDGFLKQCMRILDKLPFKIKAEDWTKIVRTALTNVQIRTVEVQDDISPGGLFRTYLVEFLTSRAPAKDRKDILVGAVYHEAEDYLFRARDFLEFLYFKKNFTYYGPTEVQVRLRDLAAKPARMYVSDKNTNMRVWAFPKLSIADEVPQIETIRADFQIVDESVPSDFTPAPVTPKADDDAF